MDYAAQPKFIHMIFIGAGRLADDTGRTQSMRLPIQII
jgi:hypothetical protein